jgi:aldehyde:ferredoxin oxidoreductase
VQKGEVMWKAVEAKVGQFGRLNGWMNRILRVDLSEMSVTAHESVPYVPAFLGARGLAARICWEDIPEPVDPFHPANPLMIFAGALTGSNSPYSGRTSVCAFSPQGYPHPWFTRSNVGGYFGAKLKQAGYDGIVITGAADGPVHLCVRDDWVSIRPADELWGLDTAETLDHLAATEGRSMRAMVIGPAGERLSRIATIHTASSSACGQGGFGAVMGAKRLKAITVDGSARVTLARPSTTASITRALVRAFEQDGVTGPLNFYGDIREFDRNLVAEGNGRASCRACTHACITPCAAYLSDVPGYVHDRKWSGSWVCVGTLFRGFDPDDTSTLRSIYAWQLARRAAFELNVLSNRYGLNQFDIIVGMVPWLMASQKAGLISDINGYPMDWQSPRFWAHLLKAIAYRIGIGDCLAEGGWAAAQQLGMGLDLVRQRYPGWGYTSHCDGREGSRVTFPFWLVSALQWMSDTRDPFNSGHGYLWTQGANERAAALADPSERAAALTRIRVIGERVYGSADAVDPYSGYRGKAQAGHYQVLRSAIKDCVSVDAHFPLIYRDSAPDGYWRLRDIDGVGDIEGPSIEYHLFSAGTGVDWSEDEFNLAAQRVCTLERALQVRHWGRSRAVDEMILPYFEEPELNQSPLLDRRHGLDREQFDSVVSEFYGLHGWDVNSGQPTHESLVEYGLEDPHAIRYVQRSDSMD